jgi:hypothetical protein
VEVVASGLHNPRGLTLARGVLLIAEAGTGGAGPCVPGPDGGICLGATGAVTGVDLHGGGQSPVLTELPSLALPGALHPVADLMAFESANDPDGPLGGDLESNPFGFDTRGGAILVADGGANDVLLVRSDAIAAGVWKLLPGRHPQLVASGFTAITDMAVGRDGSLYVLQFATGPGLAQPGALIRVRPDGMREELAAGRLTAPTGLVLDRHAAYVSNNGNQPHTREVLRIPLGCSSSRRVAVDRSVAPRGRRWQCMASEYSSPEERRHAGDRRGPGGAPQAPGRPGA